MILDGHMHMSGNEGDREVFLKNLQASGVDGGILTSLSPSRGTPEERIETIMYWTGLSEHLYPFFWIDPMESSALKQVEDAAKAGIFGFKVICSRFYPGEKKAMEVYRAIAAVKKPILFHSGILYDGTPSSKFNRPVEFEALLEVQGLRFALAHISWPWCDELIAVYGKYQSARSLRPNLCAELFVDITPGTPPIYREEALRKLLTVGFDIENNILFGTDSRAQHYQPAKVKNIMARDNEIYKRLAVSDEVVDKIYGRNLLRFLGVGGGSCQ